MLGQDKAKAICENVLRRVGGALAEVSLMVTDEYLTRFANNIIHQNVAESNITIAVRIFLGTREGMATTNRMDDAALDEVVARARASAKVSLENPEFPGLQGPAQFELVQSFDEVTAEYSPKERAEAVKEVCQLAAAKNFNAFGAFTTGTNEFALANTEGLFAYHMGSNTDFQTVVMEKDGDASGWAHRSGWRVGDVPVVDLGAEAIRKTEMGRAPQLIEPGEYAVVLDPYAVQDLIMSLNFYGMGARAVQEGRSWMVGRIGEQVFSPGVNIWDDGLDPEGIGLPFDFEGTPKKRVDIVKDGIVIGPVYDRTTAKKDGKESTGHGLPANMRGFGPAAINLFMAPGEATVEEMIKSTESGLYITRFHYTRLVHPADCVVTGMTRDGAYLIENGKVAHPAKNLRFTQSYVEALGGVEAIGNETQLLNAFRAMYLKVPALKLKSFNFTGSTV
jgi:predicted Zn-dependent protease